MEPKTMEFGASPKKPWNLGKTMVPYFFAPFGRVLSISSLFFACFATPSAAGEKKRLLRPCWHFPFGFEQPRTPKELKIWCKKLWYHGFQKQFHGFRIWYHGFQKQFHGFRIWYHGSWKQFHGFRIWYHGFKHDFFPFIKTLYEKITLFLAFYLILFCAKSLPTLLFSFMNLWFWTKYLKKSAGLPAGRKNHGTKNHGTWENPEKKHGTVPMVSTVLGYHILHWFTGYI